MFAQTIQMFCIHWSLCDDTAMHAMLSAREGIQHVTLQIPVLSHSKPDNKSLIIQDTINQTKHHLVSHLLLHWNILIYIGLDGGNELAFIFVGSQCFVYIMFNNYWSIWFHFEFQLKRGVSKPECKISQRFFFSFFPPLFSL